MFDADLLVADDAQVAYETMKANGRRLPWDEVSRQLRSMRRRG
jgi:hypothetical protein